MKRYGLVLAVGLLPAVVQFWAIEQSVCLWRRWRSVAVLLLGVAVLAAVAWWAYIFAVLAWLDRPLPVLIAAPTAMVALLALAGLVSGRSAHARG